MNLPGFTADVSVYRTNARYRVATAFAGSSRSAVIFPARSCTSCFCDTYDFGFPGTCAKLCIDGPRQLEYPVECDPNECSPRCDQATCGPCTQTCTYPSGGSFTQSC